MVPRFAYTLLNGEERWPIRDVWGNAELQLQAEMADREFRNALTGERVRADEAGKVRLSEALKMFPVALLVME